MLLETVLSLKQEEAVNSRLNQRTPKQSLQELMELSAQLKAFGSAHTLQLRKLMRGALQADSQMQPRKVPPSPEAMVITVLTWQIEAHKSAHATFDNPPTPPPDLPPRGSTSAAPQAQVMARPSDRPTMRPLTAQQHHTNHPATLAIDRVPDNHNAPPHALEAILTGLQSGGQFLRTIP